jgi:hypothetical protein
VLASTRLDTETKRTIDAMGPVQYIVAPDAVHHVWLGKSFESIIPGVILG